MKGAPRWRVGGPNLYPENKSVSVYIQSMDRAARPPLSLQAARPWQRFCCLRGCRHARRPSAGSTRAASLAVAVAKGY